MPSLNYRYIRPAALADALLHLALIAPTGAVKGEIAIAAAHLAGRATPGHDTAGLRAQLRNLREGLAAQFLRGADGVTPNVIAHVDEALRLLTSAVAADAEEPPLRDELPQQVQPASEG